MRDLLSRIATALCVNLRGMRDLLSRIATALCGKGSKKFRHAVVANTEQGPRLPKARDRGEPRFASSLSSIAIPQRATMVLPPVNRDNAHIPYRTVHSDWQIQKMKIEYKNTTDKNYR